MAVTVPKETGDWWVVDLPVTTSKRLQGRLVRVIETKDGDKVLLFDGRFPFSAMASEIIAMEKGEIPKTGVRRVE